MVEHTPIAGYVREVSISSPYAGSVQVTVTFPKSFLSRVLTTAGQDSHPAIMIAPVNDERKEAPDA